MESLVERVKGTLPERDEKITAHNDKEENEGNEAADARRRDPAQVGKVGLNGSQTTIETEPVEPEFTTKPED